MQQLDLFDLKKKKKICVPSTFEEMQTIEKLCKEGLNTKEIASKLNRSGCFVQLAFKRCGGKRNYSAEKNREVYIKNSSRKFHKLNNDPNFYEKTKIRLESLEMQVDILLETIKKLMEEK